MSQTDNVWSAAEDDAPSPPVNLPAPDYEQGRASTRCFSFDALWRSGSSLISENPGLALGGGAVFVVLQFAQLALALAVGVGAGVAEVSGGDPVMTELASNMGSLVINLLFLPLNALAVAGVITAYGVYVTTDQTEFSVVVSSVRSGIMVLIYQILSGLIVLAVAAVLAGLPMVLGAAAGGPEGILVGAILGVMIAFVPMMYVSLSLLPGTYAIALDGVSPIEALGLSWNAAEGNRLSLFGFSFVLGIAAIFAPCTLYLLFAPIMAMTHGALTIGWLAYSRPESEVERWPFFERNGI